MTAPKLRSSGRALGPTRAYASGAAVVLAAMLAAVSAGGCGDQPFVGGDCAPSYQACNLVCVDVARDVANCGACGVQCAAGVACKSGVCGGLRDAAADGLVSQDAAEDGAVDGPSDADAESGASLDGAADASLDGGADASLDGGADASADAMDGDAQAADGGDGGSSLPGDGGSADACVPPYDSPLNCGACGATCIGAEPFCAVTAEGNICVPVCPTLETECRGTCVDTQTNARNCGRCGNVCPSSLCIAGICTGRQPKGHVVVIGDAYGTASDVTSQARLLANSAFLSSRRPLRVLSYEEFANTASATNVHGILTNLGAAAGRTVTFTALGTAADLPTRLTPTSYDLLIVHDQERAPIGGLATIGTTWAAPLATFTAGGGVVIVLDGMRGATREMNSFLTSSTLLLVPSHSALPVQQSLTLLQPLSAVGTGVVSPYSAGPNAASFTSPEANTSDIAVIVADLASGEPVVVHRAIF